MKIILELLCRNFGMVLKPQALSKALFSTVRRKIRVELLTFLDGLETIIETQHNTRSRLWKSGSMQRFNILKHGHFNMVPKLTTVPERVLKT